MKRSLAFVLALSISIPSQAAFREPVRARNAMVASVSEIASRVGADVMKKGGNAVDAAIAVGFALAVTWPSAGNIGGGGFMLIHKGDGTAEAIDYRERAPLAAHRTMYLDAEGNVIPKLSTDGRLAVGVPGTVAGFFLAHQRHGKLEWHELVEPAVTLASEGFEVSHQLSMSLRAKATVDRMARDPESRRIFQRDGRFFEMGERFVQADLAKVLARIQTNPRDFYEGETAKMIVADMKANGGLITREDLRTYTPTVRRPLRSTYRGHEIITMPPPSSGGIALVAMLNMLEPLDLKEMGWHSSRYVHTMTEVMRRAFADRAAFLGDADFVDVPVAALTSHEWARDRAATIDPARATPSNDLAQGDPAAYESPETTHYTIVDPQGTIVSNTYTLNAGYGAGVVAKGTGILLNNEMDDFTSKPGVGNVYGLIQGESNAIQPRKRPLSSMTPTIVLKSGKPWFGVGSLGGPTIINTVLQVIVNVIDFEMNLQQAIDAPRFHHQWLPDHIYWEPFDLQHDTRQALEAMGHQFRARVGFSSPLIGDAHGVMIDPASGMLLGASDARTGGVAAGW
jgi:gamma-glutamyltranspeptidase / glutathione hydrolase